MALSLNEIQSTTNNYFLSDMAVDNFYKHNALMFRLSASKKHVDGGEKLKQPLWHAGPGGGAFDTNTKFNTQRRNKINAAQFDWARNYEPETYDIDDGIKNSGVAAEVDIVMNKLRMMETALMWTMGTQIYGDGTGSPTPITGLLAMLNSTTTTAYGNIQEADLAVWKPGATDTTGGTLTLNIMRSLRRDCKVSNAQQGVPSIYMTTDTLHDKYDSLLQPQQRYASNENLANAGFTNLLFGTVPIVADSKCPDGYMFGLNEEFLDLQVHQDYDFKRTDWMRPTDEEKYTMQILWAGNLTCSRREAHGFYSGLTS